MTTDTNTGFGYYATLGPDVLCWDAYLDGLIHQVHAIQDEPVPIALWRGGPLPLLVAVVLSDGSTLRIGEDNERREAADNDDEHDLLLAGRVCPHCGESATRALAWNQDETITCTTCGRTWNPNA